MQIPSILSQKNTYLNCNFLEKGKFACTPWSLGGIWLILFTNWLNHLIAILRVSRTHAGLINMNQNTINAEINKTL